MLACVLLAPGVLLWLGPARANILYSALRAVMVGVMCLASTRACNSGRPGVAGQKVTLGVSTSVLLLI